MPALEARQAGLAAVGSARVTEQAAREDHALGIDKLMGEVRALFPKDRSRCDVIFPRLAGGGRRDEGAEEPEPGGATGGAGGLG